MNTIEKIEALEKQLAELKAEVNKEPLKEDWWTPLGFDHEPQPGEWVLVWDDYDDRKNTVASRFLSRNTYREVYECQYSQWKRIAPFPMPKLGLWVAVDKDGVKSVCTERPVRGIDFWVRRSSGLIDIPKDHPLDLLTKSMTWADEPREI